MLVYSRAARTSMYCFFLPLVHQPPGPSSRAAAAPWRPQVELANSCESSTTPGG